ncbi:hypothetical protein Goarm_003422 [Gossypium armourianum]|uniref:Acyl-[acyl-carrier-protein] desaturase n=1 Tax=Gossypium armourianum TaxID=34283 RepID=A0A7J9K332_9ROSI|nr:hypothetical protein [Gossypium armourianum]
MPRRDMHVQVTHSMPPQKIEVFKSLENWVEENLLSLVKPIDNNWQPQDFLPDPTSDGFYDQIQEIQERTKEIPDDYFVVLVGDMITEEALPTYQTLLNTMDGTSDETGASLTPWAIWTRAWTAEENRHGDLLNKYLYLSGKVDMRQIEKTIQYLIASGMDSKSENNPYLGAIYTSFQERATFISHGNTAKLAKEYGDTELAKICGFIAADEKRHEKAYTKLTDKLFEVDPDETVRAFANMMRKKITMPAYLMYDGQDENLFDHFSAVAQRLGVYTASDYADIVEFLVDRWNVKELTGLSADGRKAQDFVCNLAPKIRKLEERFQLRAKQASSLPFSWIFNREVML